MISNVTSTHAISAPANYQSADRVVVGQESTELKSSSFRATEQSAESARQENRQSPEDKPSQEAKPDRASDTSNKTKSDAREDRKQSIEKERREAEQKVVEKLSARDREVRAHEQAHAAVGGQYAGSPTYSFQRGPDGQSYAVGGEVSIDTSPVPNNPEATLRKAEQIARAASAPADPSGQDRAVAAQAAKLAQQARIEIVQKSQEKVDDRPVEKEGEDKALSKQEVSDDKAESVARQEREKAEEKALNDRLKQAERQSDRARLLADIQQKNVKTNRRLLEIHSYQKASGLGRLVDKTV